MVGVKGGGQTKKRGIEEQGDQDKEDQAGGNKHRGNGNPAGQIPKWDGKGKEYGIMYDAQENNRNIWTKRKEQ